MPYIKIEERNLIDPLLDPLLKQLRQDAEDCVLGPGAFNYVITKLCDAFVGDCKCYDNYNTVIGFLEACKLEYYRKVVSLYEDKKIKENGPVITDD